MIFVLGAISRTACTIGIILCSVDETNAIPT